MKLGKVLYTLYASLIFVIGFTIVFPVSFILIQNKRWHKHARYLNLIWAKFFFPLIFLPVEIDFRFKLKKGQNYVLCPNHFSYFDIPIVALTPCSFIFVGKTSMEKIPFFGYWYRKLHITVDRNSLNSKYNTLMKAKSAVREGHSILMYPEGGIITAGPPKMGKFKDGPFRVAIEEQIPLVPVTIPYNWIILPNDDLLINHHKAKIIYHQPFDTKGLTLDDVGSLKEKTFSVIQNELNNHF